MKFRRTVLAVSITATIATLSACGGGGGGGNSNQTYINRQVPFYTPQRIDVVQPLNGANYRTPVTGIFTRDLNRDTVDEVVVSAVGFSAPTDTHYDANLQVFGFNTGTFRNETSTWLPNGINTYTGGTTVKFGDFNNDGHIDMFVPTFTDKEYFRPSAVFLNTGNNTFTRNNIDFGEIGPHDSYVTDLNGDGYADIVLPDINRMRPAVAFGSASGAFTIYRSDVLGGGAGISVADYLGNGTKTIVLTDAAGTGNYDTKLYSWATNDDKLVLTEIAILPADRFYLPKWDSVRTGTPIAPHAVRNITMDFDRDGRPDIVVFSTLPKDGNTHGYSEVQFLRNDGSGSFTDVTDTVLLNYNTNKTTSYQPQILDVNNDGLLDILITAVDYTGQYSNSVLLNTAEGKFVESYTSVLQSFSNQIKSLAGPGNVQDIAIVAGPDNKRYLFSGVEYEDNGVSKIAMYLALIGPTGTTTTSATINTVQQVWPWMSSAEANTALSQSVTQWVDGIPVLDFDQIFSPIGGLGISLTGRKGTRVPIVGSLMIPGFDSSRLQNISAVDGLGRNFGVNLSSMASGTVDQRLQPLTTITGHTSRNSWVSKFTMQEEITNNGMSYSGSGNNYSVSADTSYFNPNSDLVWRISHAVTPMSPWLAITGMWGEIKSSNNFELSMIASYDDFWSQTGVINSTTRINAGLVKNITPITSLYNISGWTKDGFSIYGGVKPYIVGGSVEMTLPDRVDNSGTMHYTQHKSKIRNTMVGFGGVSYALQYRVHRFSSGVIVDAQGQTAITVNYQVKF
jgi:hypothetical protein